MQPHVIDPELLAILRCPVGVHGEGDDPGKLRLYRDAWLICDETGYKYPIVDGIPVMLVDVGQKYHAVADAELPVPPKGE